MSNLEKKFGKFAIRNLTLYLIMGYILGYVISMISRIRGIDFVSYITLDPIMILKGQVWRLISWVLIPPSDYAGFTGFMFLILMMYCCVSIGTVLERTWGTLKYNLYILGGILFTVIGAFISMFVLYYSYSKQGISFSEFMVYFPIANGFVWKMFSTYYINMSIYMGFALTYPENMVRFMFFIPIKMKWLGIIDGLYFAYYLGTGIMYLINGQLLGVIVICSVAAAIINIFIFWLFNLKRFNPKQAARSAKFKREYNAGANFAAGRSTGQSQSFYSQRNGGSNVHMRGAGITKHKCAVCGQSEQDNPDLEFRFCSKCNGAYEYCQNHLFSHVHKI